MKKNVPVHFRYYSKRFQSLYDLYVYTSDPGLSIFFQDISEQVKAETKRRVLDTKIHEQQEQLISLLERVKDGFVSFDADWVITYCTQEAEQIMRKTRMEVVGRKRRGIGIINMMTRIEAVNGQLVIQSEPDQGCKLMVSPPLAS